MGVMNTRRLDVETATHIFEGLVTLKHYEPAGEEDGEEYFVIAKRYLPPNPDDVPEKAHVLLDRTEMLRLKKELNEMFGDE